jgi:hypothetical protein
MLRHLLLDQVANLLEAVDMAEITMVAIATEVILAATTEIIMAIAKIADVDINCNSH